MKKIILIVLMVCIPAFLYGDSYVALPAVAVTNYSGIKVFYLQDTLPQCSVYITIGAGSLYEDEQNAGISQMIALVLSLGGSKNFPNINAYIDAVGGRYVVNASFEDITIGMRVHKDEAEKAFHILADLLAHPVIDETVVATARALLKQKIKQKQDNPMEIAVEKARQCVFGHSGYGAVMTEQSLDNCTVDALIHFWKRYVVKQNVRIGIVTSLQKESIEKYIDELAGAVLQGESIEYSVDIDTAIKNIKAKGIYFVEKNIPQSTIVVATIAPSIKSESRYALELGNYIFGGGSFNSWLMNEIRVKRGYSYSTGSILRMRKNTGLFLAYVQTSDTTTVEAIEIMEKLIHNFATTGPRQEEIQWAKDALIKSYVFNFSTLHDILEYYMWLDYNGLPVSYVNNYPAKIRDVTKSEIMHSWNNVVEGYIIVIVGNKHVKEQLIKSNCIPYQLQ